VIDATIRRPGPDGAPHRRSWVVLLDPPLGRGQQSRVVGDVVPADEADALTAQERNDDLECLVQPLHAVVGWIAERRVLAIVPARAYPEG
jgi:hypothetical protein